MEDREFQNLLAIRNQLVMLLIATAGGVIWLAQEPFVYANCLFIIIGAFFISRTIVSIHKINKKIDTIIKRK